MTKSKDYLRQIGIAEKQFTLLLDKLDQEIKNDLQINKMKNRGVSNPLRVLIYITQRS